MSPYNLRKKYGGERVQRLICKNEENVMLGYAAVDAELGRSLGLTMKDVEPTLAFGGDPAEKQFMECCWCLWKAGGIELVEPFIEAAFNILPERSRSVLFQRMLTIVYLAQDNELQVKSSDADEQTLAEPSERSENKTVTVPT
jgi:hypothetical protein